jgi:hypothetical protein
MRPLRLPPEPKILVIALHRLGDLALSVAQSLVDKAQERVS